MNVLPAVPYHARATPSYFWDCFFFGFLALVFFHSDRCNIIAVDINSPMQSLTFAPVVLISSNERVPPY